MSVELLIENKIASATADKEDPNFPASYVLTRQQRQVYRSTDGTGTLTLQADPIISKIFLCGTNAETATISVSTSAGQVFSQTVDLSNILSLEEFMSGEALLDTTYAMVDLPSIIDESSTITVELYKSFADGIPVECGIVWADTPAVLPANPNKGLSDGWKDYSIVEDNALNNGAAYILRRETVRTISAEVLCTRDSIMILQNKLRVKAGPEPVPVRVLTGVSGNWLLYASVSQPPVRKDQYFKHSVIPLTFEERL